MARIRNLALALSQTGCEVSLLLVGDEESEFVWEKIAVQQVARGQPEPRRGWRRPRVNARAVDRMAQEIGRRHAAGGVDVVFFYNQDVAYAWRLARLCRQRGIPFVQQYAEKHLACDYAAGWRDTHYLSERLHLLVLPHFSAGSVVISHYLAAELSARARHPVLVVPTVAPLASAAGRTPPAIPELLAISGGARRDSLELLLEAMTLVRQAGGRTRLRIVGLSSDTLAKLTARARSHELAGGVVLAGRLDEANYTEAVCGASCHVLLRSDDVSSQACFPSRLFELFSHGTPAILSAVGDIRRYFTDGEDALLVSPGSAAAVAEKILWVERHPGAAAEIGQRGNGTARRVFDLARHGEALANYLQATVHRHKSQSHA
ncbi:MAG: glycosyltransferase family 4 protein [Opitutae bacterium]|nr:glycosyltransferase family 4 protein [Opitutae bacterium]